MISRQIAAVLLHSQGLAVADAENAVSDRELLRRFADQRDEGAFTLLVWRHSSLVWRVCRGIVANEHDAEDVFQAVFLVLARKAAGSGWHESLANWLYETAYRLARKARVAERRQAVRLGQLEDKLPAAESVDEMTVREAREVLHEELAALPEMLRMPLVLCYLEGATREQAARRLGWSHRTVERRLEQGREQLGERLVRRGIGLSLLLLTGGLTRSALGAGMPAALPSATIQAALSFAVSGSAGAGVSAPAAALANGVLQTFLLGKGSLFAVLLMTVVAAAGGSLGFLVSKAAETRSEEGTKLTPPPKTAKTRTGRVDRYGDPLPPGALARLGTVRERHSPCVYSLAFTRDGKRLLTAGGNNLPRLWDVATSKLLREFTNIPKPQVIDGKYFDVSAAILSPDGRVLAVRSGQRGSLYLLETATGKRLREFPGQARTCGSSSNFAFSPDSKAIAAQFDDRLELRDVATGRTLWQTNEKDIYFLAFSPDGKTLASTSGNAGVRLWDARNGEFLRELGHNWQVDRIAFSPNSRTLAAGCCKEREWSVEWHGLKARGRQFMNPCPLFSAHFGTEMRRK